MTPAQIEYAMRLLQIVSQGSQILSDMRADGRDPTPAEIVALDVQIGELQAQLHRPRP